MTAARAKRARLAGIGFARATRRSPDDNREEAVHRAREAAARGADLVCLPEAFNAVGVPVDSVFDVAESVPGPSTDALAEVARAHGCHVVCPIYTRRGDRCFNSAIVLDRRGAIVGTYDKAHPAPSDATLDSFELGVSPGRSPACFDLDFGRLGVQICLDAAFPTGWLELERAGVDVVAWPSAYDGGQTMRELASRHQFHIVTGVRRGQPRVIDPLGRERASADEADLAAGLAIADVELDCLVARLGLGESTRAIAAARLRFGDRAVVTNQPSEARIMIATVDPDLTLDALAGAMGLTAERALRRALTRAYAQHDETARSTDPPDDRPAR